MFEQLVESSSKKKQNRRRWFCFAATASVWLLVMTAVVAAGILAYNGRLSGQFEMKAFVLPAPPMPLPPRGPDRGPSGQEKGPPVFTTPVNPPTQIPTPSNLPPVDPLIGGGSGPGVAGGVPHGVTDGFINGVTGVPPGATGTGDPPPPPPPPRRDETPTPKPPTRISKILQGSAIRRVEPGYPPIPRAVGIGGPVVVEVVVDEKGNVISARAISGHPLLRSVAENAARGWRWNPTLLNDVPVQVVGTITFNFVR